MVEIATRMVPVFSLAHGLVKEEPALVGRKLEYFGHTLHHICAERDMMLGPLLLICGATSYNQLFRLCCILCLSFVMPDCLHFKLLGGLAAYCCYG